MRDPDDPLYDWTGELRQKPLPVLKKHYLVCGHRAALWTETEAWCRTCMKLVKVEGE